MPSFNHREVARMVAADLLDIEAVFLRPDEPFTWASGIRSPIYCDNRLILSHPHVRSRVEQGIAGLVEAAYPGTEMLMGTEVPPRRAFIYENATEAELDI